MGGRATAKPSAFQAPPQSSQQAVKAAATTGISNPIAGEMSGRTGAAAANQASPKMPSPGLHSSEVLHQTRKLPYRPTKMALGGFAVVATIAYFTLYSNKKPEATALDVAKVTTGTAIPENTRPST